MKELKDKLRLESLRIQMNYIRGNPARAYVPYSLAEDIYLELTRGQVVTKVLQRTEGGVKSRLSKSLEERGLREAPIFEEKIFEDIE